MPFVEGLYSFLSGTAGITALTGSGSSARIYPLGAPQLGINESLLPTLVYLQASRQDLEAMRETGKRRTEFIFMSGAASHPAAHALNDALETALNHYTGAMGSYTCDRAKLQDSSDELDSGAGEFVITSRYLITHN